MSLTGFAAPIWFLLLVVVAALAVGYVWMQRRRRRQVLRFANLAMLERIAPKRQGWQRHVPVTLLLAALVLFTVALAAPTAEQKVPRNRATVMLVIDVSLSMRATDIEPSRLAAAQREAKRFANDLTPGVNLGLVSFAGSATVLVSPTTERVSVIRAIDNLKLAEATGTGEAIFAAMSSIEAFGAVVSDVQGPPPARIVLLTDGKQTVPTADGDDPRGAFTAARAAGAAKIPISAISFGTAYGQVEINGERQPVPADDESIRRIADLSGGQFYDASSAGQLSDVVNTLGEQIGYETKRADASKPWLIAGTIGAMLAAAGALAIGQRLP
ncbi:MAG TPA: VWA domain-containing protein [Pseudonocardiaceae bacterium]|jgi:Ca-activated chloride channel family protein|nr:VWA domain-containing protein [Pseudonocardiaceae bacterium]